MTTSVATKTNDDTILEILQGHKTAKWPTPKLVKIFINSTKPDFIEERRRLLEFVGPQLQMYFDEHQLEVDLVDMHFGCAESDEFDPYLLEDHLNEIRTCHELSRGCFFLNLIGDTYHSSALPLSINETDFESVLKIAEERELNHDLLRTWYEQKDDKFMIKKYRDLPFEQWKAIALEIITILQRVVAEMSSENCDYLIQSTVEKQLNYALDLSPDAANHILSITREFNNLENIKLEDKNLSNYCHKTNDTCITRLNELKRKTASVISEENRCFLTVPWKPGGIDPEDETHETYLNKFKNVILNKLQTLTRNRLEKDPELKSRKKIVEENFQENITHLTLNYAELPAPVDQNEPILAHLERIVRGTATSRHNPVIVYGCAGAGKTALIRAMYEQFPRWCAPIPKILRIVRYIGVTPRSTYNLELLRVICQQICIALKLPDGFLPKDASFDPLYINNWFQTLLRMFEDMNQVLVILIDDLHRLNPLDADAVSALSWLPISLPRNCYLICTSAVELDGLRLTPVQKDRLRNPDCYLELDNVSSFTEQLKSSFAEAERLFGARAIARLSSMITCAEYGLTETELLELVMPTGNSEAVISIREANFNFSSLCAVRHQMKSLLRVKLMSGKLLIEWAHENIKEVARQRYLHDQETLRNAHAEIANIFFSEFCDDEKSESEDDPAPLPSDIKETPFQSTLHSDVTYRMRHVEESWIHLLKAGDIIKLKSLTMCNYDFLLAAVQTVSISYLRCVLEHVRCYLLDRDIELVYHTVRRATDILTRDTYQLGTQIITWLRPVASDKSSTTGGNLMATMVTAAMAWCDGFTLPLVVPLTDWLQPPLPIQARVINTPSVRLIEATPSGQHVVCCVDTEPQLWHIMSNELVHTFVGHTKRVICMTVTKQSQYLITGSEDISILVWDLRALTKTLRITEHTASVLCLTVALNNSVIVSGSEDCSIIICSLLNGKRVIKIDHHRGPVTSLKLTHSGDILVSGSQDGTVCLWSLDNFSLLNMITLQSAVQIVDVSADSVFLLALCTDNVLYLRTLATGTELHSLAEHKSKVKSVCLTYDSCRAVLGCADGRVYIYDVHSGKLTKTMSGQGGEVCAVRITDKDDFLLTAGGNRIFFYPFRSDDAAKSLLPRLPKKSAQHHHHLQPHRGHITCIDISRDGLLAASGATDNFVIIWQLNSHELLFTLNGHTAAITAVSFAPNTLYVATASEDRTVKIWGLTIGSLVATFKGHQAAVSAVYVMMDSTRIISSDRNDVICIWLADNGNLVQSLNGSSKCVAVTNNMKYSLCMHADTSLRIWSLLRDDEKYTVSHSEEITCFVLTMDSLHLITGSRDMSLKVWQLSGGKLSQVLIGHTDAVTCVAVGVSDKSLVISGSCDSNLIVWDINTGADIFTLSAHLSYITCVKASADGTIAISGSDDKSIIIWDTKRGLVLTSLQVHLPILRVEPSSDFSRISVLLKETQYMPIICLHNTPAKYVKLPTYCAPDKDIIENPKTGPKRQMRRLLKKEVSLDTYTWQKKYAHLTSNLVIPAVDERFKRRFSVSASMEEISKIPQKESQEGLPSKQGSLAQSQHFDQLEALWNKRSPPRRKLQQSISKQSSLTESHLDSSDEDKFP